MSAKRRDNRNLFYAMERANEKMGVICICTLIMQEMQNMCIAGS